MAGFALRVISISYGLPRAGYYSSDEIDVVARTLSLAAGELKPHHYSKPAFMNVLLLFIYGAVFLFYRIFGIIKGVADFERLFIQNPTVFYFTARLLSVASATATIYLCYRLGRKFRDVKTGLIAAFLLTFCYTTVSIAHVAKEDSLLVFLAYATLLASIRAGETGKAGLYFLSGLLVGFATATKYNGIIAIIFPILFMPHCFKEKARTFKTSLYVFSGLLAGICIGIPYLAIHPFGFIHGILTSTIFRQLKWETFWLGSETNYGFRFFVSMFVLEMGWIFALVTCASVLFALAAIYKGYGLGRGKPRNQDFRMLIALLLFLILNLFSIKFSGHRDLHYILPLTPALALLTACFLTSDYFRLRGAITVFACIILVIFPFYRALKFDAETTGEDTRITAARWITEHIPTSGKIAFDTDFYYQYHPPVNLTRETIEGLISHAKIKGGSGRFFSLMAKYPLPGPSYSATFLTMPNWKDKLFPEEIMEYSVERLKEKGVGWLICSSYYYDRVQRNTWQGLQSIRDFYKKINRELTPVAKFEPVPWHNLGPTILIFQLK